MTTTLFTEPSFLHFCAPAQGQPWTSFKARAVASSTYFARAVSIRCEAVLNQHGTRQLPCKLQGARGDRRAGPLLTTVSCFWSDGNGGEFRPWFGAVASLRSYPYENFGLARRTCRVRLYANQGMARHDVNKTVYKTGGARGNSFKGHTRASCHSTHTRMLGHIHPVTVPNHKSLPKHGSHIGRSNHLAGCKIDNAPLASLAISKPDLATANQAEPHARGGTRPTPSFPLLEPVPTSDRVPGRLTDTRTPASSCPHRSTEKTGVDSTTASFAQPRLPRDSTIPPRRRRARGRQGSARTASGPRGRRAVAPLRARGWGTKG